MSKHTSEEIASAIKRADKIGLTRNIKIMADMKTQLDDKGCLSDRQWHYLNNMMAQCTEEKVIEFENFKSKIINDQEFRERIRVIANYYQHNNNGYFSKTAFKAILALEFEDQLPDHQIPDYNSMDRMLNNKYADKVWESHINEPLYSAGDLVMIRSTGVNRIWHQRKHTQEKEAGVVNLNSHPCLVMKVNSRPISDALQYKPKQGGARQYRVMPIGMTTTYDVLECDLKKSRIPKSKK